MIEYTVAQPNLLSKARPLYCSRCYPLRFSACCSLYCLFPHLSLCLSSFVKDDSINGNRGAGLQNMCVYTSASDPFPHLFVFYPTIRPSVCPNVSVRHSATIPQYERVYAMYPVPHRLLLLVDFRQCGWASAFEDMSFHPWYSKSAAATTTSHPAITE